MPKIPLSNREALYPVPCVLVSCRDGETGRRNIITVAWCGVASSKPPILYVSIRPSRLSHAMIKKSRDFVINVPTLELLKEVDLCGTVSGSKVDKFDSFGLHEEAPAVVGSPLIKECPVNIECRLKEIVSLGSHDMFLGEVVRVHAESGLLNKDNTIDYGKARPIIYNQGEYWGLENRLGAYGFSRS